MFGNFFSGLGSAVIGAGSSLFNGFMNRNSAASAFADSSRLSWDMWNAANAYNTPAAQMARFKAAGLNPNLVYGQMSNSPAPVLVRKDPYNFKLDMDLSMLNQLENQELTNRSVRKDIENKEKASKNLDANTAATLQRIANDQRDADDRHQIARTNLQQMLVDLGLSRGDAAFYASRGSRAKTMWDSGFRSSVYGQAKDVGSDVVGILRDLWSSVKNSKGGLKLPLNW